MLGNNIKSSKIRFDILSQIRNGSHDFVDQISEQYSMTIQAVYRHVAWLESKHFILTKGQTKGKQYFLGVNRLQIQSYALDGLDENEVYLKDFAFVFDDAASNIDEICHYGFTEMLNNAIDHSAGGSVTIEASQLQGQIEINMVDDGEGIFKHIARLLALESADESILELSKGKLTTDPERHSGEGIFFTSRAFDTFAIFSGDLLFTHHGNAPDHLHQNDGEWVGTHILMRIAKDSDKDIGKVFDEYSSGPDDYAFERTVIPVKLAKLDGEKLVSRSQAKRLMKRVEKFKYVVLDFSDVSFIGQAFADEIFRVYVNSHPDIKISVENLNENGTKMMQRAMLHQN